MSDEYYNLALTANGSPLLSESELKNILLLSAERSALVSTLETYKIENGLEIPCIEYSMYGVHVEDMTMFMSAEEKRIFARQEVEFIIKALPVEDNYMFSIYLD